MRVLFTIAHFFKSTADKASDGRRHGSVAKDPQRRIIALASCITALRQLYGEPQCIMDLSRRITHPANTSCKIDIVVCTTGDCHLLADLPLARDTYAHHETHSEPMLLGFECQARLRDCIGDYDYYCYLEDDLILHDPWFFTKLSWFNKYVGDDKLLQPNRFEVATLGFIRKAYIDGDLRESVTARFQNIKDSRRLTGKIMGTRVVFERTRNPHSGCYFLNANQMEQWIKQPNFLDRDTSFIGPLESAASLGIMRTFKVYKPAARNANFLEVQHFGNAFLQLIRKPRRSRNKAGN